MKYLVLKRRPARAVREEEDAFFENVAFGSSSGTDAKLAFTLENAGDDAKEADRLRRDPTVEDVIPSIPLTLIAPFESKDAAPSFEEKAWGIEAVGAHTSPWEGKGVTVAILDTGIDRTHPAFTCLDFPSGDLMDFTSDDRGVAGSAPDYHGHGTHVAGTIVGRDVDGTRIGIARGVTRVLIGKVLGPKGGPTEAIFNAIQWALTQKADIISMSLGIDFQNLWRRLQDEEGLPGDIALSRALEAYRSNVRLFDRLAAEVQAGVERGRGALLVAATGNESRRHEDPRFTVAVSPPAAADGFIPVGAVGQNPLAVARFSNTSCHVCAPGVDILSAKVGGGLTPMSGTSMATPHVAGVLALWVHKRFSSYDGRRPAKWTADILRDLEKNVKTVPGTRADVGLGMVQAPQS